MMPSPAPDLTSTHTASTTSWFAQAAYGLLGLPLAMATLPVYVHIPAYYAQRLGMPLALTGWILFASRLLDTAQDPFLGRWIDRLQHSLGSWFWAGGALLVAGFAGLWLPLVHESTLLACWLAAMLALTYLAHSMLNIAYLSWGARLQSASGTTSLIGASAWREGTGLAGVIIASIVPGMIMQAEVTNFSQYLIAYILAFGVMLAASIFLLLRHAPRWVDHRTHQASTAFSKILALSSFRRLLFPYFCNALSAAIPASLFVFFVEDRLQAAKLTGMFLAIYFVAAALGLPLWVNLARRIGTQRAWTVGMIAAMCAFAYAAFLGQADTLAFGAICVLSGFALGADLALPPVLLAETIQDQTATAAFYGIWTLLGKLALACSGLALPLLAACGYQPGHQAGMALPLAYAGLPCLFKTMALISLRPWAQNPHLHRVTP